MDSQKTVWFGMKLTPQEKRTIERLAERKGLSQKAALLDLVQQAMADEPIQVESGSFLEAAHNTIGAAEGPADLLRDPDRFEGYGA